MHRGTIRVVTVVEFLRNEVEITSFDHMQRIGVEILFILQSLLWYSNIPTEYEVCWNRKIDIPTQNVSILFYLQYQEEL